MFFSPTYDYIAAGRKCAYSCNLLSMHIYFSGIGGAGIGPLAQVALQAGYQVSGSDKQTSSYIDYLKKHGIEDIHIGQSKNAIAQVHGKRPIDWFVYSSALTLENPNAAELAYCHEQNIKHSKRDEFLNQILDDKQLKLIAVAGTHGKTTTTAMTVWLFKQLDLPVSYLLPAKTSFAEMGEYIQASEYFIYEADEFDRNFLAYEPELSLISGVSWDHHEIFITRDDYQAAFKEFISQSKQSYIWPEDAEYLGLDDTSSNSLQVLDSSDKRIDRLDLDGKYNRLDAWLVIETIKSLTKEPFDKLINLMNGFPGLSRRMEMIVPNLYSDYAHTPEKIRGAMSVALELATPKGQDLIMVYEPLTNRRQHYIINEYKDSFAGATKLYWLPSYLAREDSTQRKITPEELISHLDDPTIAFPAERDEKLKRAIQKHLDNGDMVVGMAGGGGDSLDDWLRRQFTSD
jgi:UDP-N-acetylmuramate--alanine ligase